ncbi:MAG TPA: DNA polymerase III subunit alpha, partial [Stellaceae bacterium]|nr:DNA polymerase III subunit alpha [Stellaceae bacterium]
TTIDRAVRLVNKDGGDLDPLKMPLDDLKTFQMLARGETVGVFQFEGAGMRDLLKNLKPTKFEDLIAVVSLYRPGPMDSIPEYIAVKHGQKEPDYMHPMLQPILEETYGVMTYQEQVMKIAQVMAGYTLGGADLLRRAMGKKVQAEMDAQRKIFTDGAIERGIDKDLASLVFDKMAKFAGYGFNKGHAAPYAFIAYQTAYLKANHPVAFMAATMSLDAGNTDKLNVFRQELQRQGVRLLPPDINKSGVEFTVEMAPVLEGEGHAEAVRYALSAIKGVGADAMAAIVAERHAKGPYKDLFDLAERLDTKQFNKRQFENLTKAGGFDSINPNRAQTFQAAELMMRHASVAAEERQSTQGGLFGGGGGASLSKPVLPKMPDWPAMDRLQHEFEAIGFYLSAHPLDPYQMALKRLDVTPVAQLQARLARGLPGRIKLAGIVTGRKERTSARGSRFAFVALSDMSGMVEVTLFSEILAQSRALLDSGQPLLMAVDAKMEGDDVSRLTAQSIEPLDQAAAGTAAGLLIKLTDTSALKPLQELLAKSQGGQAGRAKLKLLLPTPAQEVEVELDGRFQIGAQLRQAMTAMPGIVELQDF